MIKSFFIVIIISFLALPGTMYSQQFPMLHFTLENGLPSNTVYDVYKDSYGFLWFATDKGVARYNGLKFEIFTTENGLPDNEIFFFREDYSHRLWLATYNGELCYYKNGTFHTANNTPFLNHTSKNAQITQLSLGADSSITVSYYRGTVTNIKGDRCTYYDPHRLKDANTIVDSLIRISKISGSLYEIICASKKIITDTNYNILSSTSYSHIIYNGATSGQQQYLFTPDTLYSKSFEPVFAFGKVLQTKLYNSFFKTFFKKCINRVLVDNGKFFFATYWGLFVNKDLFLLKGEQITSITCDYTGNYWIGTLNNGVYVLNRDFVHEREYPNIYKGKALFAGVSDSNFFFTLDNDNFYILNGNKAKCLFNYRISTHKKNIFENNPIGFIDKQDNYYNFYNYENIIIEKITSHKPIIRFLASDLGYGVNHFSVKELANDNNGIYALLPEKITYCDFATLNKKGNRTHLYENIAGNRSNDRIFAFAKESDNIFWYSTLTNVYKIKDKKVMLQPQFKNCTFKWFNIQNEYLVGVTHESKILICNHFENNIYIDSITDSNCIWIQSYKLDKNHLLIRTNSFYRLLTLYPSINKPSFSLKVLESPFIPLNAETISTTDSECFFLKKGSIICLPTKEFFVNDISPIVNFTVIKTHDNTFTINTQKLEISYNEAQNITLYFSVLSFSSKNVYFEYCISKDTAHQWKQIANEELNIFALGYGTFNIELRAKTLSGQVSRNASFTLVILKPFWAKWWFITLYLILILFVISFIIYYWIKRILRKREAAHKSKMSSLKSEYKVLNALMNPHFVFNTLNNVQSLVNKDDKLASNEYLRIFADLIRQNMHNLSFELIPLQKELDLVANYLKIEKLRFKEWFNYSINIDEEVDTFEIMIPPLLIQPLVENSIKHGLLPLQSVNGVIAINVYEKEDRTIIEVVDNGIGIESSLKNVDKLHESYGLENIKKRIMQLSALYSLDITFEIKETKDITHNTTGTIAVISIRSTS